MSSQAPPKSPFKGLRPFKQEEQEELFGRERDLILIKDRILSSRTTLLFAGSGVGKTSFLNAKVIPALEDRYCVIWHNRWTGAEERSDDTNWDDHPRFKVWPPKALGRWLSDTLTQPDWLRQKLSQKNFVSWDQSKPDAASADVDPAQRKVSDAVQQVISQSLRPGNRRRLSRVLSIFRKKPESTLQRKHCILILDQFEEIFQYHAYENYFQDFISDLCSVINDDSYQVRVVFSMREEFLGELSVFDNRIPDLFNNYYRLRYPEKDEARYIITETCKLVDVEPAGENLDKLVDDLATIEKSFNVGRGADKTTKTIRLVRRNFVPPPYLQIVCDTLWKDQFDNPVPPATGSTNGDNVEQKPARFLENYKAGDENAVNGEESGAQKAVREFCETKLSPPFLKTWEQGLAARAFGFLVTKQGAKMAYELRSLASHMEERVWPLKHTLQKLSRPEARILRESRGPEGSYWFELYHDMYAGVVDRWKRKFKREQRRRQRRKLVVSATSVAILILLPLAVMSWIVQPRKYRQTINQFRNSLNTTDIKNAPGYTSAVLAYSQLSGTFGRRGEANSLWAGVWQKRAQLFAAAEKREEALLCLLQAASLAKGYPSEKDYIAQANNLLTGDEESIQETYCYDCQLARLSPNGQYILTMTNDGPVDVWSSGNKKYLSTACLECSQALFSADSNLVASVRVIKEEPARDGGGATRGTDERLPSDRAEVSSGLRPSTAEPTPTPGTAPNVSKNGLGWELSVAPVDPSSRASRASFVIRNTHAQAKSSREGNGETTPTSPQASSGPRDQGFRLRAVSDTPAGYLVTGFLNGKLTIWRKDGGAFVESVPLERTSAETTSTLGPIASFSADGRFFAASGAGYQTAVWKVSALGLHLVDKIDSSMLGRSPVFSPDSKYLLVPTRDGDIKLWELASQNEVLTIPVSEGPARFGFAHGSSKFYVYDAKGLITVWDSETRKQVTSPIERKLLRFISLDNDAKTLVVMALSTTRNFLFEKWSLETGKKIGEFDVDVAGTFSIGSDGDSLLFLTNSIARLWTIPPAKDPDWVSKISGGMPYVAGLSHDGNTLLVSSGPSADRPRAIRLLDVSQQKEIFSSATATHYQDLLLSPDGNHIVIKSTWDTIDLYDRTKAQPKTSLSFGKTVLEVAFSSDSRLLAVATADKQIHVIDMTKGAGHNLNTDVENVSSLVFTQDSKYLLASREDPVVEPDDPFANIDTNIHTLDVWSMADGKKTEFEFYKSERMPAVAISNERIATFQNQKILVLNLKDGRKVREFDYEQDLALLTLSPDGTLVLTCDRKGVMQLWDAESGTLKDKTTLGSPTQRIIFDADGAAFIAISDDWIHRIEIVKDYRRAENGLPELRPTLRYANGIFTGPRELASLRLLTSTSTQDPSLKYLRWIREGSGGVEIVDSSFAGKLSKPILAGDSEQLLKTWRSKLGFEVSRDDRLEKVIPPRSASTVR